MSKKQPDLLVIEDNDFPNAWVRLVRNNLNFGFESNNAKEHTVFVRLTGNAVKQVENGIIHPQYPFKEKAIDAYCEEYTYEYLEEYVKLPLKKQFDYLYFKRFAEYRLNYDENFNQIDTLYTALRCTDNSRQLQMITYQPDIDMFSKNPPCLQRIQVRQISDRLVDLHYVFRSWDVYGAMPSNIIAITEMMNLYVLRHEYDINSINVIGMSGHVYLNDFDGAKALKLIPQKK